MLTRERLAELITLAGFEPTEPAISNAFGFRTHLSPLVAGSRLTYHCTDTEEAASLLRQARTLPADPNSRTLTGTLIFWEGV